MSLRLQQAVKAALRPAFPGIVAERANYPIIAWPRTGPTPGLGMSVQLRQGGPVISFHAARALARRQPFYIGVHAAGPGAGWGVSFGGGGRYGIEKVGGPARLDADSGRSFSTDAGDSAAARRSAEEGSGFYVGEAPRRRAYGFGDP